MGNWLQKRFGLKPSGWLHRLGGISLRFSVKITISRTETDLENWPFTVFFFFVFCLSSFSLDRLTIGRHLNLYRNWKENLWNWLYAVPIFPPFVKMEPYTKFMAFHFLWNRFYVLLGRENGAVAIYGLGLFVKHWKRSRIRKINATFSVQMDETNRGKRIISINSNCTLKENKFIRNKNMYESREN